MPADWSVIVKYDCKNNKKNYFFFLKKLLNWSTKKKINLLKLEKKLEK